MTEVDVLFIGFPVWWNRAPRAVLTFLETYDLTDKHIIPFATHGGSGLTNSQNELQTLYPAYDFLEGFAARAGSVEDAEPNLLNWLDDQDISKIQVQYSRFSIGYMFMMYHKSK